MVTFITETPDDEVINSIEKFYADIANGIAIVENMNKDYLAFGDVFSVLGDEMLYYVPVFEQNKCVYIVKVVMQSDGTAAVAYGIKFSNIINALNPGTYYFEKVDGVVYIVG